MNYSEQLKHPKWQEKRLRVFDTAGFRCARCGDADRSLHAHHKLYIRGRKPWEYEDGMLECLCEACHQVAHAERDELDRLVALRPTAEVPALVDLLAAASANREPLPALPPRMLSAFRALASSIKSDDTAGVVNAHNALQDIIDEALDFRRGPGGAV